MDFLVDWRIASPIAALVIERGYALWRRPRPHLPAAPLSRIGRVTGRVASYESLLAVERTLRATAEIKVESRDAQIATQEILLQAKDAQIAELKARLPSAVSASGLFDLIPIGTPPSGSERRLNPHERRRTRSSTATIG